MLKIVLKPMTFWLSIPILTFGILFAGYNAATTPKDITQDEYLMAKKIKSQLYNTNEAVRLSDIHQGKWKKACFFLGGFDFDLRNFISDSPRDAQVLNDTFPIATDRNNESALVFVNDDNIGEIYRITPNLMKYSGNVNGKACFDREVAHLRVASRYENFSEEFKSRGTGDEYNLKVELFGKE